MSDIGTRRPRILGATKLRLTPDEHYIMAHVDGLVSVGEIVARTGLEPARVEQIVSKLAADGAIELDDPLVTERSRSFEGSDEREPLPTLASSDLEAAPDATGSENDETPDEVVEEDAASRDVAERNYRQIYERLWHPMPVDQRIAAASVTRAVDLLALCLDPDPRVIAAMLENPNMGIEHARLLAHHHRTTTGLEILARRQDWLRDALVERRFLRNPMIGDAVLARVMGSKRILPTYKIAIDRDIPELSRVKCRGFVKTAWSRATPEERADLLLRTEGRCLVLLAGCTFDARTTSILCGRPIHSVMFIQSVAKFSATPPALLAHLAKQPFVRRNAVLKRALLAHPNIPGDVKRSF